MTESEINGWHQRLLHGKESPSAIAETQIELSAQAAYISEQLKTLRNHKPGFFLAEKRKEGKVASNEMIEMLWQEKIAGEEVSLKNDIEILDRFLNSAKACLIALSIESKVQE